MVVVVEEEGLIPPKANGILVFFIWAPDKEALIHRGEWMLKGWVPLISKLYNRSPGLTAPPPRPHNKHLISPLKQNYHHTTNHPPTPLMRPHRCTHLRAHAPHPPHFTFPGPTHLHFFTHTTSHRAAEHTHLDTHTHARAHTSLGVSAAQSEQPTGMREYYERGLIGRSL